jgi:hypothetical protein
MGWRKTGAFHPQVQIVVMTCDICERDIGYDDGRRARPHYEVSRLPNPGSIDDQDRAAFICSPECLAAFASKSLHANRSDTTV